MTFLPEAELLLSKFLVLSIVVAFGAAVATMLCVLAVTLRRQAVRRKAARAAGGGSSPAKAFAVAGLDVAAPAHEPHAMQTDRAALKKSLLATVQASTKNNDKKPHAEARMALAELSVEAGDMTTACEHWQIARTLFHDLDEVHSFEKADAKMRSNGCPTDWVLTDF